MNPQHHSKSWVEFEHGALGLLEAPNSSLNRHHHHTYDGPAMSHARLSWFGASSTTSYTVNRSGLSSNLLLCHTLENAVFPKGLHSLRWEVPRLTIVNELHFIANEAKKFPSRARRMKYTASLRNAWQSCLAYEYINVVDHEKALRSHSGKIREASRRVDIHKVRPMFSPAASALVKTRIVKDVELGTSKTFAPHGIREICLPRVIFEECKILHGPGSPGILGERSALHKHVALIR